MAMKRFKPGFLISITLLSHVHQRDLPVKGSASHESPLSLNMGIQAKAKIGANLRSWTAGAQLQSFRVPGTPLENQVNVNEERLSETMIT